MDASALKIMSRAPAESVELVIGDEAIPEPMGCIDTASSTLYSRVAVRGVSTGALAADALPPTSSCSNG